MMFQLLRFKEDPASHKVDVLIEYDLAKGGTHRTGSIFDSKQQAAQWINHVQLLYIRNKIKDFIAHKVILSEKGYSWSSPVHRQDKLFALDKCRRELGMCLSYPLDIICRVVLALEKDLRAILPLPTSKFYKSSLSNLEAILDFCKEPKRSIND